MPDSVHIRVLPDQVANKIAAGEVVERPASVLKELMENALDAGATQIEAEIMAGGRNLVAVSDNGGGMGRDDALLSVERYATSKIRDVDDIERIATLGFRGEALAAISAVARFRLCTRRAGDLAGTEILMSGGRLQDVRDTGCPLGTAVEIRNLFFNVPARRKFLRSEQTELAHIRQVFMLYALAHPETGMSLTIDGRRIHALPAQATLADRVRELYPATAVATLRAVNHAGAGIAIAGYVSLPSQSRADRSEQYIFVNGRPAGAPALSSAVREGYHSLLPRDRHPVLFLFLTLDPALVDVNVHPTKKEVRFRDPHGVRDAVIEAIRHALTPDARAGVFQPGRLAAAGNQFDAASWRKKQPESVPPRGTGTQQPQPAATFIYPRPAAPAAATRPAGDESRRAGAPSGETSRTDGAPAAPWSWARIMGQVGGLYVVMETEDGLVIMDPHAAHERVLYERFMAQVAHDGVESQGLLLAETVELPPRDALHVRRHLELLKKMGFGIAGFGGDAFVVDALPACLLDAAPGALLAELATALEEAGAKGGAERLLEEIVARAACAAAVKAHRQLSREEIENLVLNLSRAEMPYTCPHGRPTLIHISFQELGKKFGRL